MCRTAADHLRGHARALLPEPPTIWTPRTIARGCLENIGRAAWLLDGAIDRRERVIRYVNETLFSLWQTQCAGFRLSSGRDPSERVEEIVAWAEARAVAVTRRRRRILSDAQSGSVKGGERGPRSCTTCSTNSATLRTENSRAPLTQRCRVS
jgi:hypothetical protein